MFRICLTATGGIELDEKGTKKRKWLWDINTAEQCIHAPPLYPMKCKLSPAFDLHIVSRQDMTLTYSRKGRACRFNIGTTTTTMRVYYKYEVLDLDI